MLASTVKDLVTTILLYLCAYPISDSRNYLSSQPDMRDLQNYVVAKIPHRWRSFGTQLGMSHTALEIIEQENCSLKDRFTKVLHEWEKREMYPFTR